MFRYELVAVRKASSPGLLMVELNTINDGTGERTGPRIHNTVHIEASQTELDEIFGQGWKIYDQFTLENIVFVPFETAAD